MKQNKKKYIVAVFILCVCAIFAIHTTVFAISAKEMMEQYKANPAIINTLSQEELDAWQKEMEGMRVIMSDPNAMGAEADKQIVNEILAAVKDRKREENTDLGATKEELKAYDSSQIRDWLMSHDISILSKDVIDTWRNTITSDSKQNDTFKQYMLDLLDGKSLSDIEQANRPDGPSTGTLGSPSSFASHTPDEIINEANEFTSQGSTSPIDGERVKEASSTLYNLLLSIGIFLAVAIGVYLGVKFMLSTAEDKAKVKEALIPYVAGCVVIFSAFIVWKAIILLLGDIA